MHFLNLYIYMFVFLITIYTILFQRNLKLKIIQKQNELKLFLFFSSYVFWFGDLNFRVEQFSKSQIESFVAERDYDVLMRQDQVLTIHYIIITS